MYILIAQFVFFTFYIGFVWYKVGIQYSISESWYKLGEYSWLFTVILCYGMGILQILHGGVWFSLSGACLLFTGSASDFKKRTISRNIHNIGAVFSGALALIGLWLNGVEWVICPILISAVFCQQFNISNRIWWVELVVFCSIMTGLFEMYKYQ